MRIKKNTFQFLKIFCITDGYILYIIDSSTNWKINFVILYMRYYYTTRDKGHYYFGYKKSNIRALLVEQLNNLIMNLNTPRT